MIKEKLQQQQKIVYQTLSNILTSKQLAHCYLFTGPQGSGMKEAAFLFAQSLICEHKDVFACEQCTTCQRIRNNEYLDLVYIDGNRDSIKKEAIEDLQSQFEKTAVETAGIKVFIIDGCENMTAKSANSLLKFIEEPYGQTIGIFITSQPERLLKTIVSRCQIITFRPINKAELEQQALAMQLTPLEAHFIGSFVSNEKELKTLYGSKAFTNAISIFKKFTLSYVQENPLCLCTLQNEFGKLKTDSSNAKQVVDTVRYFLEFSFIFIEDYLLNYRSMDSDYQAILETAKQAEFDYTHYLNTFVEIRNNLNRHPNNLLLIDQLCYKLMGEKL